MALNYSPATGYGTQVGNQFFVQTPQGGTWSGIPASQGNNFNPPSNFVSNPKPSTSPVSQKPAGGGNNYQQQWEALGRSGERPAGWFGEGGNQPQSPQIDFDALIQPAIQGYENAINQFTQSTNQTIGTPGETGNSGTYEGQRTLQTQQQQGQTQENLTALNRQGEQQQQQTQNAISDAQRMYNEMQQGITARYGGRSSAGVAFSDIAGQQTQRNVGMLQQGLQRNMQDINDKITQVRNLGALAIQQVNQNIDNMILKARTDLQNQIAQIKSEEGTLQSNKAQMAANAISHYQDMVNNFKAQREQQAHQYAIAQLNAETQLKAYGQRMNTLAQSVPKLAMQEEPLTMSTPPEQGMTADQGSIGFKQLEQQLPLGRWIQ